MIATSRPTLLTCLKTTPRRSEDRLKTKWPINRKRRVSEEAPRLPKIAITTAWQLVAVEAAIEATHRVEAILAEAVLKTRGVEVVETTTNRMISSKIVVLRRGPGAVIAEEEEAM